MWLLPGPRRVGTGAVVGAALGQTPEEKAVFAFAGGFLGVGASWLLKPFLPTNKIDRIKAGIVFVLAGLALPWLGLAAVSGGFFGSETEYYPQLGVLGNMLRSPSAFAGGVLCVAVGTLIVLFALIDPWKSVRVRLGMIFSVWGATVLLTSLPNGSYDPRLGIMALLLQKGDVFAGGVLFLVAGLGLILFALADRLSRPQTRT